MKLVQVSHLEEPLPITVFHIKDNLNMGNTHELVQEAEEAYRNGARNLILDLAETRFLSSAGISGIIQVYQLFNRGDISTSETSAETGEQQANKHLRMCNCHPAITNILTIAGLVEVLGVYDSLENAVASFNL